MIKRGEIEALVDLTSASTIYGHLENNLEIKFALNVKELDIIDVVLNMVNDNLEQINEWIENKELSIGINLQKDDAIRVIYLPPVYIYKETGEKYY